MIQAIFIHIQKIQCIICHFFCDHTIVFYLGKIPHPLQKTIRQTRCSPGTLRQFNGALRFDLHLQNLSRPHDDRCQFLLRIKFQMVDHAKAIPKRRSQHSCACRRADQREFRKIQTNRSGCRSFSDHNIDGIVFHRRIEHLLHLTVQPMDLIHK